MIIFLGQLYFGNLYLGNLYFGQFRLREGRERGEFGQLEEIFRNDNQWLLLRVMMVVDMVYLGTDSNLWFLGIVTVQQSLEISRSILQLVLDRISDLPEQTVGLAGSLSGQSSEGPHDALLGGELDHDGDQEEAENSSHGSPCLTTSSGKILNITELFTNVCPPCQVGSFRSYVR